MYEFIVTAPLTSSIESGFVASGPIPTLPFFIRNLSWSFVLSKIWSLLGKPISVPLSFLCLMYVFIVTAPLTSSISSGSVASNPIPTLPLSSILIAVVSEESSAVPVLTLKLSFPLELLPVRSWVIAAPGVIELLGVAVETKNPMPTSLPLVVLCSCKANW